MKKRFKITALFVFALVLLVSVCGCKGVNVDGAYYLPAPQEGNKYSVLFEISDPKEALDEEHFTTTQFTRLKGVYIKFRTLEQETERVKLILERCAVSDGPPTYIYSGEVEAKNAYGVWLEPFDLSVTKAGNLVVESFMFYRIYAEEGASYIDEIVFVGETLSDRWSNGGTGTGEYIVLPATVVSATPYGDEASDQALRRARTLLNEQPASASELIK